MGIPDIRARVEAVEESYEFFLAYAAQGLTTDEGSKAGLQLREFLKQMDRALDGLADQFRAVVDRGGVVEPDRYRAMIEVLEDDVAKTRAVLGLVGSRPGISSQLLDNLNASIHVRALLTDLFLLDEALEPG